MFEWIQNTDIAILNWLADLNIHSPFMDTIMIFITHLGDGGIIWILIAVAMLLTKKYRQQGMILALALILCLLACNLTLKPLVARIRPFDLDSTIQLLIAAPKDFSFPSGHTLSSFASAMVIFGTKNRFGAAAFILAGLIAFSRLYLYVHYPSDVIAAVFLGIVIGCFSLWVGKTYLFKSHENRQC